MKRQRSALELLNAGLVRNHDQLHAASSSLAKKTAALNSARSLTAAKARGGAAAILALQRERDSLVAEAREVEVATREELDAGAKLSAIISGIRRDIIAASKESENAAKGAYRAHNRATTLGEEIDAAVLTNEARLAALRLTVSSLSKDAAFLLPTSPSRGSA